LLAQIDDRAELILIDSCSDADSAAMVRAYARTRPQIRFARLDQPGVSRARNKGVAMAKGDWVVLVDDDAVPFPDWYKSMVSALTMAPAKVAGIGGKVLPKLPKGEEARQLDPTWWTYLSIVDAPAAGSVTDGHNVVAANYAVRRCVLEETNGFDEELGRIGCSLVSAGDSHITHNFINAGYDVRFDPAFGVFHKIPPERLQHRWINKRVFMEGLSIVRMHRHAGAAPWRCSFLKLLASLPFLAAMSLVRMDMPRSWYRTLRAAGGLREYISRPFHS